MKHLRKGNIAFWRYDRPGKRLLGGRIVKISGKAYPGPGHAMIEGYGYCWFEVRFCLPKDQGKRMLSAMGVEEARHSIAVRQATAEYLRCMNRMLPKGVKKLKP